MEHTALRGGLFPCHILRVKKSLPELHLVLNQMKRNRKLAISQSTNKDIHYGMSPLTHPTTSASEEIPVSTFPCKGEHCRGNELVKHTLRLFGHVMRMNQDNDFVKKAYEGSLALMEGTRGTPTLKWINRVGKD